MQSVIWYITTFKINLAKEPEKLSYTRSECDLLEYTTTSTSAKGPVDKIKLIFGGVEYKKVPSLLGTNSVEGENLYVVPKSKNVGNIKEVRIINQGFEYSSDRTLEPQAFISPYIILKDSNTIGIVTVTNGGKNFILPPQLVVVNKDSNASIALKFRERPDLLIICQPNENQLLLREAFSLQIPVLAFVDSNTCLDYITYPIPVNTENHDWMYYCLDLLSRIANCFSSSK